MFYQESIEGRVSDAGLEVTLNRMGSAETQYTQNQHNTSLAELDHQDTLTQDIVNRMDVAALTKQDYSDDYCDSLQVFCQKRISITHQALQQVTMFVLLRFFIQIYRWQMLWSDLKIVKICSHPADTW